MSVDAVCDLVASEQCLFDATIAMIFGPAEVSV